MIQELKMLREGITSISEVDVDSIDEAAISSDPHKAFVTAFTKVKNIFNKNMQEAVDSGFSEQDIADEAIRFMGYVCKAVCGKEEDMTSKTEKLLKLHKDYKS